MLHALATLLQPVLAPESRTWWPGLVLALWVAMVIERAQLRRWLRQEARRWTSESSLLDLQLLLARQGLRLLFGAPAVGLSLWLATHLVFRLDRLFGRPELDLPDAAVLVLYSTVIFVAWDASRYVLHRLLHTVPALWELHQVHHSAEVLTPLTFHRLHPLESLLFTLRGLLVTTPLAGLFFWLFREQATVFTVAGVHGVGLACNLISGNLRHSHVWLSFGPRIEGWLISPAQHQLHHSRDLAEQQSNYGTWLALWDRLGGTLRLAERPPVAFGLDDANHDQHLLSAWLQPVAASVGQLGGRRLLWLAPLLLAWPARAQEPPEPAPDEGDAHTDDLLEIVVLAEDGVPRVAGSAHVVTEAELEALNYDDVSRVVQQVPGVYVRDEDGFGLRPNIGIRAANSDRSAKLTLLEDGVPLAPAPYAAPAAYYFPATTRMVGVEVFKGPAATLYGPQTIGGAVNLRTRAVPEAPLGALDLAVGLRQSARVHGYAGTGNERAGLLAETVLLTTKGFKELDGGGPTGFLRTESMLKGRLATDPALRIKQEVELKLGYSTEQSHETYLGLAADDYADTPYRRYAASSQGLMQWQRTQAELAWTYRSPVLRVRTVAYHHYLSRAWTKLNRFAGGPDLHAMLQHPDAAQSRIYLAILRGEEDSVTPEQTLLIGTNDRRYHSYGIQSRAIATVEGDTITSRTQFGVAVHVDDVRRVHTEQPFQMVDGALVQDSAPEQTTLDSDSSAIALSAYAHEELTVGRFSFLPSFRLEAIHTAQEDAGTAKSAELRVAPLPGAAVLIEPALHVQLFGGVHRGFSPVAPGNGPEVLPETSWNYEVGTRLGGLSRVEVVGFLTDYQNVSGQCTFSAGCDDASVGMQFNGGAAWAYGVESGARHTARLGAFQVPLEATYTFTRTRFRTSFRSDFPQFGDVSAGDAFPYVPLHQGSARISLVHPRFAVNLAGFARSAMLDAAGTWPATDLDVPPIFTMDATAEVRIVRTLTAYVTGTNVTNSKALVAWRPFGARPTSPLQVMVGVRVGHQPASL